MINQSPITPPPQLVEKWNNLPLPTQDIIAIAWQHGADQELEACCEWLKEELKFTVLTLDVALRAGRRPKPPSLKEQAIDLLAKAEDPSWDINDFSIVRRALEQLPDEQ